MLGGKSNVISVGAMRGPTGTDGGVIVYKTFCPEGRDGGFVVIEESVDLFVGRLAGIAAREMKEVEHEFNLR